MKVYLLKQTQILPLSLERAWQYFSNAANLPDLTPPWLKFEVQSELPERMYPGMIARYTVRPILGIPMQWVTEITQVEEKRYFIDEQRFGPYRFWHHQHHFREVVDGVEMTDLVHYALPLGPAGQLVHSLSVYAKLQDIFAYRRQVLEHRFGEKRRAK